MTEKNVGIVNVPGDARAIVDGIRELEKAGIPAVWLTTGAPGPDALTIFSAAAAITDTIKMGTAITPTWASTPSIPYNKSRSSPTLPPAGSGLGSGRAARAG